MNAFAVLDVVAWGNMAEVAQLYSQVVARNFIHLYLALINIVRTEANENGISPFFSSIVAHQLESVTSWDI